ncbi:hypothetical protein BU26DRAFT_457762 [Trematosphaeria pertusa]|uniref:Uncharacterized protein n=1 Tax=Trematosphaeria pertusa TaxID=390896 RepID=A0A6A6IBQ3_9PLEO|nr:uncharacterized protein BU26DRAFT_457762 [Trematosphaeria pertusa]KAF2247811.1 hypothetical protein BU26DRAFT_457762 [Trematosphaeria pertusa]
MTRRIVYGCGLLLTIACTAMTIASIVMPRWVSFSSNDERKFSMGLHRRCSSVTGACHPFPQASDCSKDKYFCSMWRTVGFLISFDVVIELCTLVAFCVIIAGGVQRRTAGYMVLCALLLFGGIVQCAGMAIVAFLYDHHERFFEGWYLDASWSLCTASWSILVLTSLGIAASAFYLPAEGDYELVPDRQETVQDEQLLSRIDLWNDGYRRDEGYQQERDW